jgi:Domain of unknown function (DUF4189)
LAIIRLYDPLATSAFGGNMRRTIRILWLQCAVSAIIGTAAALWPQPSIAAGAIAIGIPPGGVVKGFAGGHSLNAPDMASARVGAVNGCNKSTGASDAAKKACAVVASFKDECYAIALDPKDGTPGAGWAIAETQALADDEAVAQCRNTSSPDRQKFCEVPSTNHGCDGTAK